MKTKTCTEILDELDKEVRLCYQQRIDTNSAYQKAIRQFVELTEELSSMISKRKKLKND